jgi:hypothetical protein
MEPGTTVRLKADPGRVGIITGKVRERAGKKAGRSDSLTVLLTTARYIWRC